MADLFPEHIETDRLVLDPLHGVDVHRFYGICSADDGIEAVTEYVPWSPHDHPKETREFLDTCEGQWAEDEGASYVVRVADGDVPASGTDGDVTASGDGGSGSGGSLPIAGATGLSVDWDRRLATLGLWLRERFWGRGYSGERAAALAAVAFDHLDLETVAVTHHAGNEKSRRAIERYVEALGGRHEGLLRGFEVADHDAGGAVDAHRYTITAEEFDANRSEQSTY